MSTQPKPEPTKRPADGSAPRRRYCSPRLTELGDVRSLILGGSPGIGDTGNPTLAQAPAG